MIADPSMRGVCSCRVKGVKCQRAARYFLAPMAGRKQHVLSCGMHLKLTMDAQLKAWGGVIVGAQ